MKKDTFLDLYGPKHTGVEDLKNRLSQLKSPPDFKSTFTATTSQAGKRPQTLLDFYMGSDARALLDDLRVRPEHYDERQRAIIEHLAGANLDPPPTDREKDDLLLHWMRTTELDSKSRDLVKRISDARHRKEQEDKDNEETIMEDGRSLKQHMDEEAAEGGTPSFEKQDFGPKLSI